MDFVKLTKEEVATILTSLDREEVMCLKHTESILQKIAGIYINHQPNYHPEMADLYRFVASTLSELNNEKNNVQED